jgi:uncharacterized alkaline shock family protein YloU
MAATKAVRDRTSSALRIENYSRGIKVSTKNGELIVDVHLIAKFGVKLSEVTRAVQKRANYDLDHMLGIKSAKINVIVDGVKA